MVDKVKKMAISKDSTGKQKRGPLEDADKSRCKNKKLKVLQFFEDTADVDEMTPVTTMPLSTTMMIKLASFRMKELKDVLTKLGLPKQGRKQDLVERLPHMMSDERMQK